MDVEASSFETSETLAILLASTPLLSESWRLCNQANTTAPLSFVTEQIGDIAYVSFSGVQIASVFDNNYFRNLEPLDDSVRVLFAPLNRHFEGDEPVLVHAGFLNFFLNIYHQKNLHIQIRVVFTGCYRFSLCACTDNYKNPSTVRGFLLPKMSRIMEKCKSIVITGHSIGGTIATLCALWLLSSLQPKTSNSHSIFCVTFGSPLIGNHSLAKSIHRQRWGGKFCHVISNHDIIPRITFAPLLAPFTPQLNLLLRYFHLSMTSPQFGKLATKLSDTEKSDLFRFVLVHLEMATQVEDGLTRSSFQPFGTFFFCTEEGGICVDNETSVVKMLHLMLATSSSPNCSIEDHLKYGDYIGKISLQFLKKKDFMQENFLVSSSYEAGVSLALQSSGIASQEFVASQARDCLKMARRIGLKPNLNSAKLAVKLSEYTPYRAQIEWYKAYCDDTDERMGYYDSFKQSGFSKKGIKVNLNRLLLGQFWDELIHMLDNNELPPDFDRREKWVNASQFYKLLVEPLDIAEYYRTGMHREKGHYLKHGRERRYEIFDRWWKERDVNVTEEENIKRTKFASLTQDSCFWARVEEARDLRDKFICERDPRKSALLWESIENFEAYARGLVQRMEVSRDVIAKNSSYSLWVEEVRKLKLQKRTIPC